MARDRNSPAAVHVGSAPLDALNFFLADVRDGLGPFLAIYLMASRHWDPGQIGVVMTIAGIATVAARAPAGALVDAVRWKRGLVVAASVIIAAASILISLAGSFWPIAAAETATGACDAIFPPALAAITLGLVGRRAFAARIGRNEAFNHAGNAVVAVVTGLVGWAIANEAMLWLVAVLAVASSAAVLSIDGSAIDHKLARGGDDHGAAPERPGALFASRPLLVFTAAITLFHLANAAMLPLLGERLAQAHRGSGPLFMAACIITAQIVMVPMAILVGRKADDWGRKPLFLAGFAVLPLRGILYTLTDNSYALVAIQILDGVGAGIFGALFFIVVADLTKGTGRYNLAQGAVGAAWGLGAAVSNTVAGFIASQLGFDAAFLALAGIAVLAFLVYALGVPETRKLAAGG